MNLDADAMLKESADRMADVAGALASRCVLLVGQLAAAQREIETLRKVQDTKPPAGAPNHEDGHCK